MYILLLRHKGRFLEY